MLQLRPKVRNNLGVKAEDFTVNLLVSKGYKIICRNFRSRFGEIDIVAEDGPTLVFVEVKARQSLKFGLPEEAVTEDKIRKLIKTGQYFSLTHPNLPQKLRIEVVSLLYERGRVDSFKIIPVE